MLVARGEAGPVEAASARRGAVFRCPVCDATMVLRRGRIRIAHFAHKTEPCAVAARETLAHLGAKAAIVAALRARGLRAEPEFMVAGLPGDRRADVMAWSPSGRLVAVELQHASVSLDEIERRAFSYARADIAQLWIAFAPADLATRGETTAYGRFLPRFAPRPFEKWIHGLGGGAMWMFDPADGALWRARLSGHALDVPAAVIADEYGDERNVGGYERWSRRFRDLTLAGPFAMKDLRLRLATRTAFSLAIYRWPAGPVAELLPADPARIHASVRELFPDS
jgi:competence protein CoiA